MAEDIESARLAALASCSVMDTGREAPFDNVVFTGSQLLRVPTFYLALVGQDRVWAKAAVGPKLVPWSRVTAFCRGVVEQGQVISVGNLLETSRFGPVVGPGADDEADGGAAAEGASRFGVGVPIPGPGGHWIGCLCAIDVRPRSLSPRQLLSMHYLAVQAGELLQIRAPLVPLPRG